MVTCQNLSGPPKSEGIGAKHKGPRPWFGATHAATICGGTRKVPPWRLTLGPHVSGSGRSPRSDAMAKIWLVFERVCKGRDGTLHSSNAIGVCLRNMQIMKKRVMSELGNQRLSDECRRLVRTTFESGRNLSKSGRVEDHYLREFGKTGIRGTVLNCY